MTVSSSHVYGFRVVGGRDKERKLVDWTKAFAGHIGDDADARTELESYLSLFQFGPDFRDYFAREGTTRGFSGSTFATWLWFDIDRENDIARAQTDARRLVGYMCDRWNLDPDSLLLFFSGSKGYHVGVQTAIWGAEPSPRFNYYCRCFAEMIAAHAAIEIDSGIYDRVRLFRAPNSCHPKTGLRKRRLTEHEYFRMSPEGILALARDSVKSEIPPSAEFNARATEDWTEVVQTADCDRAETETRTAHTGAKLNKMTRVFIAEGAASGDRHRLLYSAAANLAEFQCPPNLAHALLTPAALDSGLTPSDVRRQIDCGLQIGGRHG